MCGQSKRTYSTISNITGWDNIKENSQYVWTISFSWDAWILHWLLAKFTRTHQKLKKRKRKLWTVCISWLTCYFDIMVQVNSILSAIKRKKSMDTIILSLVASVCTFLIFIYWLSKWGCIFVFFWLALLVKLLYSYSDASCGLRRLSYVDEVTYFFEG